MKILWVTNIPIKLVSEKIGKSLVVGGGWLDIMAEELQKNNDFKLISFSNDKNFSNNKINNIEYYIFNKKKYLINEFELILKEFSPDIIHIWGTEYEHTLDMVKACENLNIIDKVIISIQGLCSEISKHYFNQISYQYIKKKTFRDLIKRDSIYNQMQKFENQGLMEIQAIQRVENVIGRTSWDKACTYNINTKLKYYHCNEILRESFYTGKWNLDNCEKYSIFLSQGHYPVKGLHIFVKALFKILDMYPNTKVYIGGYPIRENFFKKSAYEQFIYDLIKKYNLKDRIFFLGNLSESEMKKRYLKSHLFVCPSLIENSPNSVGEAMILGVPVVASYVGGIPDLLLDRKEGLLYQSDSETMLANNIIKIFSDDELARNISENAIIKAKKIHNKQQNLAKLINIYTKICKEI